ncbi:hypothetical protein Tco_0844335 [Tanacetum coccineum]
MSQLSANEELYPSCDYVTRLDFMAKFTYFKVKGKLTDSIFNEMLEFFQHVFPTMKGYKLPPSYYAIKKTFKTIGLGYESIHACVNDCFLFRGDNNKDVHFCPVCKTSRLKDSNTPRKEVPKKVLCYFPIIPRLQCLYKSSHTAKEMTWHATGKCTEPGKMQHPVDGRAWKNFDTKYPNFEKEPRNVRLGLVADGFNPFGNLSQAYNMWPMILTTYNLPPWLCFMGTEGVETIDVAIGQKFNMRAMVLWTINNFPARSSLSGWSGQGYKACLTCNKDTPSVEDRYPPRKFDQDQIQAELARLPTRVKGKHPNNDPGVSATNELFALSSGPTPTPILVNSCVVNGVRFVMHNRDERRTTQNSDIFSPGGKDGEMYYGHLQEIIEFSYLSFKVVLFRVKWFDTSNEGRKVKHLVVRNNMTQILTKGEAFKDDQYILATQVKQCFYLEDMARRQPHSMVVKHVNHKKFLDGGVIVVEKDPDVILFDNSSDIPLSTSLNDLDNATLHIDGQSTEVDTPPDIIDLDEDDDIIDNEDALPHDLADFDDEDLVNVVDDDGVDVVYSSEEED